MTNDNDQEPQFRLSLRTTLIFICLVGAGVGLLGRLNSTHPEIVRLIVGVGSTVVPFLLAVGTIVRLGVTRRKRGFIVWGTAIFLMPILGLSILWLLELFREDSRNFAAMSNSTLIEQRLAAELDAPWIWNELTRRAQTGALTREEAEDALLQFATHMQAKHPAGWDQPLHWQNDFLKVVNQNKLASESVFIQLYDAFYGKPRLMEFPRLREDHTNLRIEVRYGNTWDEHSGLKHDLLWHVTQVRIDDKPIALADDQRQHDFWNGQFRGTLPVGEHLIEVDVVAAYVDRADLVGLRAVDLKQWPTPIKQWTQTIASTLTVFPQGTPLVDLVADPDRDPQTKGSIRVQRLVAQLDRKDLRHIVLQFEFPVEPEIAVSFDVELIVAGKTIPLGRLLRAETAQGTISGGNRLETSLLELDPAIQIADILLKPNPGHVESEPGITEIWGKEIRISGVQLERLDVMTSGTVVPDTP